MNKRPNPPNPAFRPEEKKDGIPKPERLRDVPHYLSLVIKSFFKRLLYATKL